MEPAPLFTEVVVGNSDTTLVTTPPWYAVGGWEIGGSCSERCMQCHILRYALYVTKTRAMPPKIEATTMAAVFGCDMMAAAARNRRYPEARPLRSCPVVEW